MHQTEGNYAEAVRQYRSYRELIHRELGIEPSALMEDLMRGIRPSASAGRVRATAS